MRAPLTDATGPGPPVTALVGALDRLPQRLDLAFGGEQVGLVGLVAHDLAVAEVHQLEHGRHPALRTPDRERIEPHLEQCPGLELLRRGGAGLVVDDPDLAARCDVEPVDVAAQVQAGRQLGLNRQLAVGGLDPPRILQGEVPVEHDPGSLQPGRQLRLVREQAGELGLLGGQPLPFRPDERVSRLRRAARRRLVEQVLENGVHERPAYRGRAGWLGQPVDDAEPVEEGAGEEVAGPGRGQRPGRARGGAVRRHRCLTGRTWHGTSRAGAGRRLIAHAWRVGDRPDSCRDFGARRPGGPWHAVPRPRRRPDTGCLGQDVASSMWQA